MGWNSMECGFSSSNELIRSKLPYDLETLRVMSKHWIPLKMDEDYEVVSYYMQEDGTFEVKNTTISSNKGVQKDDNDIIIFPEYKRDSIIINDTRNLDLMDFILACTKMGRSVVVLCERVAHVYYLYGFLKERINLKIGCIVGKHKVSERNEMKNRFAHGDLEILIASSIFDEGEDIKNVGAVALAGGGESMVRQIQRIGRGVRKKTEVSNWCPIWFPVDTENRYVKEHSIQRLEYLDRSEVSSHEAGTESWDEILIEFEKKFSMKAIPGNG